MENIYIIDCEARQPWEPVNVDGMGLEQSFHLVRSGIKKDSATNQYVITYLDRVEVTLCQLSPRTIEDAAGKAWHWFQLEVYLDNSNGKIHKSHDLVVSRYPYSLGILSIAPFKSSSREKSIPPVFSTLEQAINFTETTRRDYWDKGNHLIASITKPTGNDFKLNIRNIRKKAQLNFGVCENFNEYVDMMMTEVPIQKFIEKADIDELSLIGRKNTQIPSSIKQNLETIMRLSIQQALAGPYKEYDKWLGKPVSKLANSIFCEHINTRIKALEYYNQKALKTSTDHVPGELSDLIDIFPNELILYIEKHGLLKDILVAMQHDDIQECIEGWVEVNDSPTVAQDYLLQALSDVICQNQYTQYTWDIEIIVKQIIERFKQLTKDV